MTGPASSEPPPTGPSPALSRAAALLQAGRPEQTLAELATLPPAEAMGRGACFVLAAASAPGERGWGEAALDLEIANHPLMAPLRPVMRLGALKTWGLAILLVFGLRALGLGPISGLVAVLWVLFCVCSWVVPPLVRRWARRNWR